MTALYIASWTEVAGKTALCAGIGRHLQSRGKKVGYLKPVALAETDIDKDTQFLKQTLGLKESVEALCPLRLTRQDILAELKSASLSSKVKQAYSEVVADKDIVLLEGLGGLDTDTEIAEASYQIVEALDGHVVIVIAHSYELDWKKVASSAKRFAQHSLGIVINQVPQSKLESIRTDMISLFANEGIKVLGVLPEERLLLGVTIAELAEHLQASLLCCPEASSEFRCGLLQSKD
jgi:BioD-like phosphotransacetylase family protein